MVGIREETRGSCEAAKYARPSHFTQVGAGWKSRTVAVASQHWA